MQSIDKNLLGAYRRRALLTPALLSTLAAGMVLAPMASHSQAPAAQDTKQTVQTPPVPGTAAGAQTGGAPAGSGQAGGTQTGGAQTGGAPAGGAQNGPTTIVPRQRRGAGGDPTQGGGNFPGGGGGNFPGGGFQGFRGNRGSSGNGGTMSFDFHGADITFVLQMFSQAFGQTITADASVSGPVTILSSGKQLPLDDAFRVLQSVLAVRGFAAQQMPGNIITIGPFTTLAKTNGLVNTDKENVRLDPRNQIMTQIIPLDNVEADALAKDLQPLISTGASLVGSNSSNALILTDTSSNIQKMLSIVESLDKTSSNAEMVIYPLRRAEASVVASVITNIYSQATPRGNGGGRGGNPNQPQIPGQPGQQGATAAARPTVVAVADGRTNSVIVIASRDKQTEIAKKLIATLDDDDTNTLDTKFIKIKYADAATIANLVNSVLSNMHGTSSSGGGGGSNFGIRAFGFDPFGFGNSNNNNNAQSTDPFGKVVADPRTNSLLVTASSERMAKIEEYIKSLDQPVPTETTTFVIPVSRANANDVSTALGQAFGTASNNNQNFNPFNNAGRNNTAGNVSSSGNGSRGNINRSFGGGNSPNGRSAAPVPPPGPQSSADGPDDGSAIPQGVAGVLTPDGQFVPTNTNSNQAGPTRQFFGFGGGQFGGNRRQTLGSSTSPQYGRGSNGSQVNLLQLQGNVFTTPTPNGDGIIVTTTPDNIEAVKAIVEQLDVVPRQVMIEVVVAEVTLDSGQKLGFSASGMLNRLFHSATTGGIQNNQPVTGFNTGASGTALDAAASGFQFVLNNANYSAVLQALDTSSKVKILATPKVFTSNNQEATINIQQFVPYISGQTTTGLSTAVSNTVQYLQVGFSLDVTPRITRDGQVTINLTQEASELLRYQTLGTGQGAVQAPVTNDRYADTSVTVQNNDTIVIGGLIRQSENINRVKVPLLGDIPLLGQFFQTKERTHENQELVIFLTPHVVNNAEEARALAQKTASSMLKQIPELGKQQPALNPDKKSVTPNNAMPNGTTPTSPTQEKKADVPDVPQTPQTPGTQNPNIKP